MYTAAKKIEELRSKGWKVHVRMDRAFGELDEEGNFPILEARHDVAEGLRDCNAKGGVVTVILTAPGETIELKGQARCHPRLDNFNKKIGLEIAFGRAWKLYDQPAT